MIARRYINGIEVTVYSVGQLAAQLDRHPASIRRLEREGVIPKPRLRHENNNYRLYTMHEVQVIKFIFNKFKLQRGVKFPEEAAKQLSHLFKEVHAYYDEPATPLPEEALTEAMKAVRDMNRSPQDAACSEEPPESL